MRVITPHAPPQGQAFDDAMTPAPWGAAIAWVAPVGHLDPHAISVLLDRQLKRLAALANGIRDQLGHDTPSGAPDGRSGVTQPLIEGCSGDGGRSRVLRQPHRPGQQAWRRTSWVAVLGCHCLVQRLSGTTVGL